MSRNGSGGYTLPVNSWNPAVNTVAASAIDWQALINDVAAAIQQSISNDGQTPLTGNLNMNNNKLTGLSAGMATGQSIRWEQLFSQGVEADLASAATTDIGAQNTTFLKITGATTITSFGTNYNGPRFLRFSGAVLLTYNVTTLIIGGGANVTTQAGDTFIAVPKATAGTPDGWYLFSASTATVPLAMTDISNAGATITWNVSNAANAKILLDGNKTFAAPTGLTIGWKYLVITQGASPWTITWNAAYKHAGVGTAFAPDLGSAGKKTLIGGFWDGVDFLVGNTPFHY